jgi:hypothetical protein
VGEVLVPWFQLASMAQTRAGAKALRNAFAWVVVLAGYQPTPAEEMDGVIDVAPMKTPEPAPVVPQKAPPLPPQAPAPVVPVKTPAAPKASIPAEGTDQLRSDRSEGPFGNG